LLGADRGLKWRTSAWGTQVHCASAPTFQCFLDRLLCSRSLFSRASRFSSSSFDTVRTRCIALSNLSNSVLPGTGGWPILSVPISLQLRVPHPLRFSKGGNLERLRDEMFSVSAFLISRSRKSMRPIQPLSPSTHCSNTANSLLGAPLKLG
jgi:hypothetical protein